MLAAGASGIEDVMAGMDESEWLVEHHRRLDAAQAEWLLALARFDRQQHWSLDGQLSAAEWLQWRLGMGRATAFEKLRVAHAIVGRPVLARALATGRASYCAIRAIVRAEGASWDVDEALVQLAEAGTVADVERAVAHYRQCRSQEMRPGERAPGRSVRIRSWGEHHRKVEIVITSAEAAELEAALIVPARDAKGAAGVPPGSSANDDRPGMERRADAFMELTRSRLAQPAPGADRYMAHVVVREDRAELLDGTPLAPHLAAQILCDASTVLHLVGGGGEPLAVGRRQRVWSIAQRRAVTVRDGGRCRWPGCERTGVDLHHIKPWEEGGHTDVSNAVCLCPRHHTAIHAEGFFTTGQPDRTLTFHRPRGTVLGESSVPAALWNDAFLAA